MNRRARLEKPSWFFWVEDDHLLSIQDELGLVHWEIR
jgi:hypothetical protein